MNFPIQRPGYVDRHRSLALLVALATLLLAACGSEVTLTGDATVAGSGGASAQVVAEPTSTATPQQPQPASTVPPAPTLVTTDTSETPTATPASDSEEALTPGAPLATGGAAATFRNVQIEVGETYARLDGDQPVLDVHVWVDHLEVVEWVAAWRLRQGGLILEDPAGTPIAADAIVDHVGSSVHSSQGQGKGGYALVATFETPGLVEDVDGWNLVAAHEDQLGAYVPLAGPSYVDEYPLALRSGDEQRTRVAVNRPCTEGIEVETIVNRASVDIETSAFAPRRATPTRRFVAIDLVVTDTSDLATAGLGPYYCGQLALWPNFLLSVDGVDFAADSQSAPDLKEQSSVVVELGFWIPVDAKSIELRIGDDGSPVANWDLSLPPVPGEAGAEFVRGAASDRRPDVSSGISLAADELTTIDLETDGASESILLVDYTLQSAVATNADPDGRSYVIAELLVESSSEVEYAPVADRDFSLRGPDGQAYPLVEMRDSANDKKSLVQFQGRDSDVLSLFFETPGLVTDPTGWSVEITKNSTIPANLPLGGQTDTSHTFDLPAGANRTININPSPLCRHGSEMDARVERALIGIEGPTRFYWSRVNPGVRLFTVDLALTHMHPDPSSDPANHCGNLLLWPDFRVVADGRSSASTNDLFLLGVEHGATEIVTVSFAIPEETRTLELYGGVAPTLIAGWELRDNSAVLTEFEAVAEDDRTLVTLDESVLFAFGESTLQRDAEAPLTRLAAVLVTGSEGTIDVLGHTDSIGDDTSNQQLSEARAQAVAEFLISAGVDQENLVVAGAGESQPVAANTNDDGSDNPDGRAQNRRVEIRFTAVS